MRLATEPPFVEHTVFINKIVVGEVFPAEHLSLIGCLGPQQSQRFGHCVASVNLMQNDTAWIGCGSGRGRP
ncbi:MAG: hypothetical protein HC893_05430, partial [Chloroflexaceae bacterium]|nr:hypothetical protein [Chloroflexaceae bacterium]